MPLQTTNILIMKVQCFFHSVDKTLRLPHTSEVVSLSQETFADNGVFVIAFPEQVLVGIPPEIWTPKAILISIGSDGVLPCLSMSMKVYQFFPLLFLSNLHPSSRPCRERKMKGHKFSVRFPCKIGTPQIEFQVVDTSALCSLSD